MPGYDYLIVGGGMTAAAAVKGIREVDPQGSIGILSAEPHPPYKRPPLTKKLWMGKPEEIIWITTPQDGVTWMQGSRAARLDPEGQTVYDEAGQSYAYGRLLLATGGVPRRLPFTPPETVYFRTLDDYHAVRRLTGKGARFGVIGGGFIGSEIAAALALNGEQAVMVFPESGIGARLFPADLANHLNDYYRQKGVEVYPGVEIQTVERRGQQFALRGGGREIVVDHIIAGIGIRPNIELAQSAGIETAGPEVGGGIVVDEHLRTNRPAVYAAGDAAAFYNPALGRRMRVEHEDNANTMGYFAGLNMAGRAAPYHHLPFFYSDLFDLGYEAVGELDSRLETYADWKEPYRAGVIYYLKDRRVAGVLLWNTWDQVDAARKLIAARATVTPAELKGRLPEK